MRLEDLERGLKIMEQVEKAVKGSDGNEDLEHLVGRAIDKVVEAPKPDEDDAPPGMEAAPAH